MAVTLQDVIPVELADEQIKTCIDVASRIAAQIRDRQDLHGRDYLERFSNVLLGEIAEYMVLNWLERAGKSARSAVDKAAPAPDLGHDLLLKTTAGQPVSCSVKSSLSAHKDLAGILSKFTIATTRAELRDVNIQVYFWLDLHRRQRGHRVTVPTMRQAAIVGWIGARDVERFATYTTERREAPAIKLRHARPMAELLPWLG